MIQRNCRKPATTSAEQIPCLVIAAGAARRFGSDKRCAPIASDRNLLEQTLACYEPFFDDVFLALSAATRDDDLAARLQHPGVTVLRCKNAERGMGATLAEATGEIVSAVSESRAILVALGDMPLIGAGTIADLLLHADPGKIVYPVFAGRRGHPVLFGAEFFQDLSALGGDRGGSRLFHEYVSRCVAVETDDPGVLQDVDTPDDLALLRSRIQVRSSGGESG